MQRKRGVISETSRDALELRRAGQKSLSILLLVVAYVWEIYLLWLYRAFCWELSPPALLGLCLLGGLALQRRAPRLAISLYALGTGATALLWTYFTGPSTAPYALLSASAACGILLRPWDNVVYGLGLGVGYLLLGGVHERLGPYDPLLTHPLMALGVLTGVNTIGARALKSALNWAWESFVKARDEIMHRREQQGRLRQALRSMDEASYRLQRMNYELATARDAAREIQMLKQQFVANVSHELRTPLALVVGFAEMVYLSPSSYGQPLPQAYLGDIREIYLNSRHLLGLVDDVLDLSRFNVGKMLIVPETVDPVEVVNETVGIMRSLIEGKGLTFAVEVHEPLDPVRCDAARVRQVLINLLNNARRFTSQGEVRLSVWQSSHRLHVAVSDTGIGIAEEEQSKLFEAFHQVDGSLAREHDGTGLGLAISREIVELHGGRIWVTSDGLVGRGSTFHVEMPIDEQGELDSAGIREISGRQPTGPEPTVLLIGEDERLERLLVRRLPGYSWVRVADPKEASEAAERYAALAAVVGPAAMATSRASEDLARDLAINIPVIACPLGSESRVAQYLGVQAYLVKPVEREVLLGTLETLGEGIERVLIVDDDRRVVALLARMLQSSERDYQVMRAYTAEDGLARLRRERIDVLLLDLVMPQVDGAEMITRLRGNPSTVDLPIVVVTSRGLDVGDGLSMSERYVGVSYPWGLSDDALLAHLQGLLSTMDTGLPRGSAPPSRSQEQSLSEGEPTQSLE